MIELIKSIPVWVFPSVLIGLDVLAAFIYFCHMDVKKGVYWSAAAVLTLTVTI